MADARWLSEAEQRAWRAYLEATMLLFDALERQLQADADMPHGYYEILVRLSEAEGRALRMNELAACTRSSRSRLSHAVARLQERGWVRRHVADGDRRGQVATLTDLGLQVLVAAAPGHVETVRAHVIDRLAPEQVRQLEAIARAIIGGLTPTTPA